MNQSIKQFLKPDWKKILLSILLLALTYYVHSCFSRGGEIHSFPGPPKFESGRAYCSVLNPPLLKWFAAGWEKVSFLFGYAFTFVVGIFAVPLLLYFLSLYGLIFGWEGIPFLLIVLYAWMICFWIGEALIFYLLSCLIILAWDEFRGKKL